MVLNNFIIVDCETGGLDPRINPLLSIGAVNMKTDETFYGECNPGNKPTTFQALRVNGINLLEWREKPSVVETIRKFSSFLGPDKMVLGGHNPRFDLDFIQQAFWECEIWLPFSFRTIDMHTLAYAKYGMSLNSDEIYQKLGMDKEPRPHNALNGAIWEADAFRKLMNLKTPQMEKVQ